jgi:Ca-activated chloride channel family protein
MIRALSDLHFLRPWWLAALIPAIGVWWAIRAHHDPLRAYRTAIAPHLLEHLVVGEKRTKRLRPVTLLLPLLVLAVLALSGPAWRKEPSPFADEKAAIVVIMKVTPTMEAKDLQPSRLERSKHKLRDLIALRPGEPVGLIAYSGSAHVVMPPTRDGRIVEKMAEALSPAIMPVEGDVLSDALELALLQFERRGARGTILVIADGVSPGQLGRLEDYRAGGNPPVQVLAAVGSREVASQTGLDAGAQALGAPLVYMTVDETDVERISRGTKRLLEGARAEHEEERWRDEGYLLLPFIALLALMWARKGFAIGRD